ncbi:MAG: ABC transporter substrate-binding protein [Lachnospiraceae bacterium]|nr:ABC transporter substrate-binding protein [Lachnospiraceae bacterium]
MYLFVIVLLYNDRAKYNTLKKEKHMKKLIKSTILLILAASMLTACSGVAQKNEPVEKPAAGEESKEPEKKEEEKELTKIRISDLRSEFWLPAYVAQQLGYYEEEGLEAEFVTFKDGPVAFQSMHAGEIDFCMLSTEPVLIGYDNGLKSKILFTVLKNKPFMLISNSEITEISQLKGTKIAAGTPGSGPYAFITSILKKNGIDPLKEVELINMDYNATLVALENNQIQATFFDSTRKNDEAIKNANVLVDTTDEATHKEIYGSTLYESSVVTTTEKIASEEPEKVQKFTNAIAKAFKWQNEHTDEEIAELIAPLFEGTDMTAIIPVTRSSLSKDGIISEEGYKTIVDFCIEEDIIKNDIPFENIIDNSFIEKSWKEIN